MRKQKYSKRWTLILTTLLLITPPLFAEHFHYFIDIESTFNLNQHNQLEALKISWVYDEKMSALMKKQNADLKELGQVTINDLHKQHYFMNIQFNGKPVKTGPVKVYELQEFTDKGQTVLQLDFVLPLQTPLAMTGNNTLTWNFADPTGIAIMTYYKQNNIRLGNLLKSRCTTRVEDNKNIAEHGDPEQRLSMVCSG